MPVNRHSILDNDNLMKLKLFSISNNTTSSKINFGTLFSWKEKQTHDIGKWLGADNVGMDKKPDNHPCMLGVPDDEANLLLFLLMYYSREGDANLKLMEKDERNIGPGYCAKLDWCP